MRKRGWIFLLLFVLLFPSTTGAQEDAYFDSVQVEIWPEYDRPQILVIMHMTLTAEAALPQVLSLRIPSQAEVNAVAVAGPDGSLINSDFDEQVQGKWRSLSLTATSAVLRVEYYLPMDTRGQTRRIQYEWPGDHAVGTFSILFQQPVDSGFLISEPEMTLLGAGEDGLTYYELKAGSLEAGEGYLFSIEYRKTTDRLSVSGMEVEPISPFDASISVPQVLTHTLPWILGGLGLLLLVLGVYGLVSYQRSAVVSAGREGKKKNRPRPKESTQGEIFCHQCGKRAQPGDQFCRTCGVRLKHSD